MPVEGARSSSYSLMLAEVAKKGRATVLPLRVIFSVEPKRRSGVLFLLAISLLTIAKAVVRIVTISCGVTTTAARLSLTDPKVYRPIVGVGVAIAERVANPNVVISAIQYLAAMDLIQIHPVGDDNRLAPGQPQYFRVRVCPARRHIPPLAPARYDRCCRLS
jgi:hypothetical protein